MTPEITVLEVLVLCGYDVPDTPGLIGDADGQASAAFGGDWLRTGQKLGLVLPSVVVPQARNLLLNPLHLKPADQEPFQLDQRLG
jgi:RES domain-containing protein